MKKFVVVYCTASSVKEGRKIAKALVSGKYVACVSMVPKIESRYWWKGKIEVSSEVLLIMKTKKPKVSGLVKKIRSIHSYDVPEIIVLPIIDGHKAYIDWINKSVS